MSECRNDKISINMDSHFNLNMRLIQFYIMIKLFESQYDKLDENKIKFWKNLKILLDDIKNLKESSGSLKARIEKYLLDANFDLKQMLTNGKLASKLASKMNDTLKNSVSSTKIDFLLYLIYLKLQHTNKDFPTNVNSNRFHEFLLKNQVNNNLSIGLKVPNNEKVTVSVDGKTVYGSDQIDSSNVKNKHIDTINEKDSDSKQFDTRDNPAISANDFKSHKKSKNTLKEASQRPKIDQKDISKKNLPQVKESTTPKQSKTNNHDGEENKLDKKEKETKEDKTIKQGSDTSKFCTNKKQNTQKGSKVKACDECGNKMCDLCEKPVLDKNNCPSKERKVCEKKKVVTKSTKVKPNENDTSEKKCDDCGKQICEKCESPVTTASHCSRTAFKKCECISENKDTRVCDRCGLLVCMECDSAVRYEDILSHPVFKDKFLNKDCYKYQCYLPPKYVPGYQIIGKTEKYSPFRRDYTPYSQQNLLTNISSRQYDGFYRDYDKYPQPNFYGDANYYDEDLPNNDYLYEQEDDFYDPSIYENEYQSIFPGDSNEEDYFYNTQMDFQNQDINLLKEDSQNVCVGEGTDLFQDEENEIENALITKEKALDSINKNRYYFINTRIMNNPLKCKHLDQVALRLAASKFCPHKCLHGKSQLYEI